MKLFLREVTGERTRWLQVTQLPHLPLSVSTAKGADPRVCTQGVCIRLCQSPFKFLKHLVIPVTQITSLDFSLGFRTCGQCFRKCFLVHDALGVKSNLWIFQRWTSDLRSKKWPAKMSWCCQCLKQHLAPRQAEWRIGTRCQILDCNWSTQAWMLIV